MGTSTSSFGVGKRESHDSTDFYAQRSAAQTLVDHEAALDESFELAHVVALGHPLLDQCVVEHLRR